MFRQSYKGTYHFYLQNFSLSKRLVSDLIEKVFELIDKKVKRVYHSIRIGMPCRKKRQW